MSTYYVKYRVLGEGGLPKYFTENIDGANQNQVIDDIGQRYSDRTVRIELIRRATTAPKTKVSMKKRGAQIVLVVLTIGVMASRFFN